MQNNPSKNSSAKHIHIIGICGVGTGALAVAFHKAGWKVTGSDKGFYPPVSTHLTEAGITYYPGWHPEKFDASDIGRPDIIMVGGSGTSLTNPEAVYAKEHNIPVLSFAQAIGEYLVRENSIVTVGTWGKTTSAALLSFVMKEIGMHPSYFAGGLSLSHDTGEISNTPDSIGRNWSVVEGDEYQAAIWDRQAKFNYYKPTHLLLSSVSWDHADLYPTEADYFKAFEKLIADVSKKSEKSGEETSASAAGGTILACIDNAGVKKILATTGAKYISYGTSAEATYRYHDVKHTKAGLSFDITYTTKNSDTSKTQTFHITSPMLGSYNAENIASVFAMAHHVSAPTGATTEQIITAISKFKGIKRRLERRLEIKKGENEITILDCHAPTPEKAASNLKSIREVYSGKVIAIYEPNIGGRQRASISTYNDAFKNADIVLLPRFTKLKIDATKTETDAVALEADELAQYISKTNANVSYIEEDTKLVELAISEATTQSGDNVIAFLGSHGFRGMIEEIVTILQK